MDFENDPAADFLNREKEILGDLDLEKEITNGTYKNYAYCIKLHCLSIL